MFKEDARSEGGSRELEARAIIIELAAASDPVKLTREAGLTHIVAIELYQPFTTIPSLIADN